MLCSSLLVIQSLSNPTPAVLICIPLRLILGRLIFVVLGRCLPVQNFNTSLEEQVLFSTKPPDWMIRVVCILRSVKVFENAIVIFVKRCSGQGQGYEGATYFVLNSSDAVLHFNPFLLLIVGVDIIVCFWFWHCLKVAAGASLRLGERQFELNF